MNCRNTVGHLGSARRYRVHANAVAAVLLGEHGAQRQYAPLAGSVRNPIQAPDRLRPHIHDRAKHLLHHDRQHRQARATVVQVWGQHEAAKAQIRAAQEQVTASEMALNGVRDEAQVGQRTTLDVLNAQQALVNAPVSLVTAQRERVVASYALLAAVGRLSPQVLGLVVPVYDPMTHYQQVRDAWIGVRTPDGR